MPRTDNVPDGPVRRPFLPHVTPGDGSPRVLESNVGPAANDEDRYRSVMPRGGIRRRPGLRPGG